MNENWMKNITIYLPEIYIDAIAILMRRKIVPSRSEAVRTAIRDYLYRERRNVKIFLEFCDEENR